MSETMTELKPDERGRALAGEYADWLAHGNSTGSLSPHAVEGLAIHFTQALAAAEAKGRADRLRTEAEPVRVADAKTAYALAQDIDEIARELSSEGKTGHASDLKVVASKVAALSEASIAAADALTTLRERVARLEEVLRELEDTLTPAEQVPPKDPAYGDEVRALGLRIGFGALMASASHEWRQWLADNGYPLGSEFVAGPCRAVLASDLRRARTAIGE